jgi:titin
VKPTATNASSATGVQIDDGTAMLRYNTNSLVPSPPSAVRAVPGPANASSGSLTVSFTPGANNGSPITSFTATCTSSNGGASRSLSRAASPIIVANLTTAKSYKCTVRATSAHGTSPASAASLAVIVGSPAVPTAVTATRVSSGQLRVAFTPGANNGSTITSFTTTCTSTNGGTTRSKTATAGPITVTSLTGGKTYQCAVTAKNARGAGPASRPSPSVVA